jgi:hypothetical protein
MPAAVDRPFERVNVSKTNAGPRSSFRKFQRAGKYIFAADHRPAPAGSQDKRRSGALDFQDPSHAPILDAPAARSLPNDGARFRSYSHLI